MASLAAKYVSKRILKEGSKNNFGQEDPYFETVPATRLDGRPTTKKRKKAIPPGISAHDAKVLTKVKRRAYHLDMSLFNCCGIRFGWSSVIGIVPGIGDVIDTFMALMVLRTCTRVEGGLPSAVLTKMYLNIALDFGIGLVPFLGDFADALFRANTRNAVELERHLRKKGADALKATGTPIMEDPTDPDLWDRTVREEERTGRSGTVEGGRDSEGRAPTPPRRNSGAGAQKQQRASWFGVKKQRPLDVERDGMGQPGHTQALGLAPASSDGPVRANPKLQKGRPEV